MYKFPARMNYAVNAYAALRRSSELAPDIGFQELDASSKLASSLVSKTSVNLAHLGRDLSIHLVLP